MLTPELDASPRQAAEALETVTALRRRTRRSLGSPWFPLVCFGGVTMLSAPLIAAAGTVVLVPIWLVGGVAGMLLTHRHYRRRARRCGVTGREQPVWIVAVAMFVACLAAGVVVGVTSGQVAGVLAPIVVALAGYLALGWLQRNPAPPLALVPGAAIAGALALAGQAPWMIELSFGAACVAAGTGLRAAEARS